MNAASEARKFLCSTHSAVLSTQSARFEGYPFGSITPFVLTQDGQPLILISAIAEHTKNIRANPQVSLIAFDPTALDLQAGGRLTLLGMAVLADKQEGDLHARYLRYFPQSEKYFDMHDFLFYRIEIRQARYIGGFGNIHWIAAEDMGPPANQLAQQESAILEHMNADHADSLIAYCCHVHGRTVQQAIMVGMDSDGFDLRADGRLLRFTFETPVTNALEARAALVALSKASKV